MSTNPIVVLAKSVVSGDQTLVEAIETACSQDFTKTLLPNHVKEASECFQKTEDSDPRCLGGLSCLTIISASLLDVDKDLIKELSLKFVEQIVEPPDLSSAASALDSAIESLCEEGLEKAFGLLFMKLARYCYEEDEHDLSIKYYLKAKDTYQGISSSIGVALCDKGLGHVYSDLHRHDEAVSWYESAKATFSTCGDELEVANCDYNLGDVFLVIGEFDKGFNCFKRALNYFEHERISADIADCEFAMGEISRRQGDYAAALCFFQRAKEKNQREGNDQKAMACDLSIGTVNAELGDHEAALKQYESAREYSVSQGDESDLAICDLNIADSYRMRGEHASAVSIYEKARLVFEREGLRESVAACELRMGECYSSLGYDDRAISALESAKETMMYLGLDADVATCDFILGNALLNLGSYDQALTLYRSAQEAFTRIGMQDYSARCMLNEGILMWLLGQTDRAMEALSAAKDFAETNRMESLRALAEMWFGNILGEEGQYDEAKGCLLSARNVFSQKSMPFYLAFCDLFVSDIHFSLDENEEAVRLVNSAREVFSNQGTLPALDICDTSIGNLHSAQGDHATALKVLQISRSNFERHGRPEAEVYRVSVLGDVYSKLGRHNEAASLYSKAIDTLESIRASLPNTDMRGSFLESRAPVYYDMIKTCLSLGQFGRAIEFVERLKSRNLAETLAARDLSPRSANEEERMEYQRLRFEMKALANRISKEDDAVRASALRKEMKKHERDYQLILSKVRIKDPSFDPEQQQNLSYDSIKELVADRKTAIVMLLPLHDCTAAFIIASTTAGEPETVIVDDYDKGSLGSDIIELAERYDAWREGAVSTPSWFSERLATMWNFLKTKFHPLTALSQGIAASESRSTSKAIQINQSSLKDDWEDFLDGMLKRLYKKIFCRLTPYLKGVDRILFVPHGAFHLIPLHAMFTETDGGRRYVIDDYKVSYAPSAKVLHHCRSLRREQKRTVKIFQTNTESVSKDLAYSADEVEAMTRLFDDCEIFGHATRLDFNNNGRNADILHYSGHADMDSIHLHSESNLDEVVEYTAQEIFANLDLPNSYLATLSGCETGMVELQSLADEYVGLPSAFLNAGAANVISSLWSVSDVSTSLLMKKMYELIKLGMGASQALNEAQRWLKDPSMRHQHLEYLPEWCKKSYGTGFRKVASGTRFSPGRIDPELILPEDLSRPYHWAGWVCSGAD